MDLASLFATAILSIATGLPAADAERRAEADRYAADVAAAVGDDVELGLALIASVEAEGRFEQRIERCECKRWECDRDGNGRPTAFGLPQLHREWFAGHSQAEICALNALAFELAARALDTLRRRHRGVRAALRFYVGCSAADRRVVHRVGLFNRLRRRALPNEKLAAPAAKGAA